MVKHLISKNVLTLLALSALLFITNLWGYPLFDVDEPRYAETAREMLTSPGDWITPHFNWVERFDKPVLFYWLIALSYKLFGISEFSARLVSALAASGLMLMLYGVVKHVAHARAGMITALVFATMGEVYAMARWSVTDMTLATFMAGTWLSLFLVLVRSPRWYMAAGLCAGLGMLTKGPVALALPGLTFLLALGLHFRPQWRVLYSPWILAGLGLFLLVAMPWYWAVAQANPQEFVGKFFFLHNVERFTSTVSGHSGPWFYYIPVLLAGAMPWTFFLPGLAFDLLRQRRALPPLIQYTNVWFWVVFLFFSISGTKLITYVLPGFPALAILMGWFWQNREASTGAETLAGDYRRTWISMGLWLALGIFVLLMGVSLLWPYQFIPEEVKSLYSPLYTQVSLFVIATAIAIALMANRRKHIPPEQTCATLGIGMAMVLVFVNFTILPQAAQMMQSDIVAFAKRAAADGVSLGTYRMKKPSLVFYNRQQVYYYESFSQKSKDESLNRKILHSEPRPLYLVVKNHQLPDLAQHLTQEIVLRGRVYSLVRVAKIRPKMEKNQ